MTWVRRRWLSLTLVAAVLAGAVAWIVYGTAVLGVGSVRVEGTTFIADGKITKAASVSEGKALATVDTQAIAQRVSRVPAVETVSVAREWPDTIVIDVTERSAVLAVPSGEKFTLVDRTGVAFRTVSSEPSDTVRAELNKPGPDDLATTTALTVCEALTPELEKELVKVDGSSATRMALELKDSRTVVWGDASASTRKAEVATVLIERSGQHFDVSAPDVPTVS